MPWKRNQAVSFFTALFSSGKSLSQGLLNWVKLALEPVISSLAVWRCIINFFVPLRRQVAAECIFMNIRVPRVARKYSKQITDWIFLPVSSSTTVGREVFIPLFLRIAKHADYDWDSAKSHRPFVNNYDYRFCQNSFKLVFGKKSALIGKNVCHRELEFFCNFPVQKWLKREEWYFLVSDSSYLFKNCKVVVLSYIPTLAKRYALPFRKEIPIFISGLWLMKRFCLSEISF